jgi:hypothetical protein
MEDYPIPQPSDDWPYEPGTEIDAMLVDLPEEIETSIEVPMTLVLPSGFARERIADLLDELQSGEQGLGLGEWGRLHVGWGDAVAREL